MKRALVVGCQGQDGRLLLDLLAGRDYAITGLSRRSVHLPDGSQAPPVDVADPTAVAEAVRQHAPQARFFYAGSCLAYGAPSETPQAEDTCFRPECVYDISKAAGIQAVRHYRRVHGLFAVAGILYNHESHLRAERTLRW